MFICNTIRRISTTPFRRFEANTRVLQSIDSKSLRDLWYESKYGCQPVNLLSWDFTTGKIKENRGLVIAKGKNTVEELIFTCAGTLLVNSEYKFYTQAGKAISNEYLAPKDELFTITKSGVTESTTDRDRSDHRSRRADREAMPPSEGSKTPKPSEAQRADLECRLLMSHSYRVEDTFEILIKDDGTSSNYIVMISDTTGIVVKANPTGMLSV